MKKRYVNNLILLIIALIWGAAFVAQSAGMDYIGPFTFNSARSILGGIVLIPVIYVLDKKRKEEISQGKEVIQNKKTHYHRWYLLWFFLMLEVLATDRDTIYNGGKSRIYHGIIYSDCSNPGAGRWQKGRN